MHLVALRVVDVGAVLVDEDAGLVEVVVGVAGHEAAALEDADAPAAPLGELAGAHGAGEAGADDEGVVGRGVESAGKPGGDHGLPSAFLDG